ncbi:MAG TPA: SDR family NAD(P)-dependent oxidoreductase [Caulobacteraceae bacterium]
MPRVLVTGASRGVGLAIARRLARAGFEVTALARSQGAPLSEAIEEARAAGHGEIAFIPFDLADVAAIAPLVRELKRKSGPLFGLVNNAGIGGEGLLANMANAAIESLVQVNTLSPIILTKFVARGMMAAGEGRIVNVSSIMAHTGYGGLSVYAATKASMIGFTRSLAREVGGLGVTVNAVAPGFLDTEMTQGLGEEGRARVVRRSALRRLAGVEDVAAAVEFLLGEGGRNITGTVMTIDAGATA